MFQSTFFLVLMVCVATARFANKDTRCPRNMEYKECGTRCPETCVKRGPRPCVKICQEGCFCKKGYILEFDGGRCIRKTQCPQH